MRKKFSFGLLSLTMILGAHAAIAATQINLATQTTGVLPLASLPINNQFNYGAMCDGVTGDDAALTTAGASGPFLVAKPTSGSGFIKYCKTNMGYGALAFWSHPGGGRVGQTGGHLTAPTTFTLNAPPATMSSYDPTFIGSAFDADYSNSFAIASYLTGTALGTPASGQYLLNRPSIPFYLYQYNSSGVSYGPGGSRTGGGALAIDVAQAGQGDHMAIWCNGVISSTNPTAANGIQNPTVGCLGGAFFAGADQENIEILGDLDATDYGHDISVTSNFNFNRAQARGDKNNVWLGYRFTSDGTKPLDAMISFVGKTSIGLDMTNMAHPDLVLEQAIIQAPGTGYTVGDELTAVGGTCDQALHVKVLSVTSGVPQTIGIERSGKCSVAPTNPVAFTGGTGTGFTGNVTYGPGAAIAMNSSGAIYWTAFTDSNIYQSSFPNTFVGNNTYTKFNSSTLALETTIFGNKTWSIGQTGVSINGTMSLNSYTVASLTSSFPCSGATDGMIARVNDATSPSWNTTVTGGGAVKTLVMCNGSTWVVH